MFVRLLRISWFEFTRLFKQKSTYVVLLLGFSPVLGMVFYSLGDVFNIHYCTTMFYSISFVSRIYVIYLIIKIYINSIESGMDKQLLTWNQISIYKMLEAIYMTVFAAVCNGLVGFSLFCICKDMNMYKLWGIVGREGIAFVIYYCVFGIYISQLCSIFASFCKKTYMIEAIILIIHLVGPYGIMILDSILYIRYGITVVSNDGSYNIISMLMKPFIMGIFRNDGVRVTVIMNIIILSLSTGLFCLSYFLHKKRDEL